MRLLSCSFLLIGICLAAPSAARAQTPTPDAPQEVGEGDVVRVTTSLVKVPVSVRDREGRYVSDLKPEDFRVQEGGVEQRIAYFGNVEEPISVVLLLDVSCSIEKPADTINAALTFIEQLRPDDAVLPITFGAEIKPLVPEATRDRALLRERLQALPGGGSNAPCDGRTRLYDAVEFVIHRVLKKGGRLAVVLMTDGNDSRHGTPGAFARTLRDISEAGAPFYSVRLIARYNPQGRFTGFPGDDPLIFTEKRFFWREIDTYVGDLARLSGGRSYPASNGDDLKKYFAEIGNELRHQYLLAYHPPPLKGVQERRKIKVRVNRPKLAVRARDTYIYVPPPK